MGTAERDNQPASIAAARQRRMQAQRPDEDDLVERLRQIAGVDASVWDDEGDPEPMDRW